MNNTNFTYLDMLLGEENLNMQTAILRAFWCPIVSDPSNAGRVEQALTNAAKFQFGGLLKVSEKYGPAFAPPIKAMFGSWNQLRVRVPDGQILKFQGKRTHKGEVRCFANMYIQVRAAAAQRECRMQLTCQEKSVNPEAFIRGNFDILSVDQVRALGVIVNQNFEGLSAEVKVRHTFADIILVDEKQAPAIVEAVAIKPVGVHNRTITIARTVHKIEKR